MTRHALLQGAATALIVSTLFAPGLAVAGVEIVGFVPEAPKAYEPVHLRLELGTCDTPRNVTFSGGRIVVEMGGLVCGVPAPGEHIVDVPLGRLPPGTYPVDVDLQSPDTLTATVTVAEGGWYDTPIDEPAESSDVSGVWGIVGHASHGLTLSRATDGSLAGLLFTYDDDRRPTFYSLQGTEPYQYGEWHGQLFRTQAGPLGGSQDPPPSYSSFENVTLIFADSTSGEMCIDYPLADPPLPTDCYDIFKYPFH